MLKHPAKILCMLRKDCKCKTQSGINRNKISYRETGWLVLKHCDYYSGINVAIQRSKQTLGPMQDTTMLVIIHNGCSTFNLAIYKAVYRLCDVYTDEYELLWQLRASLVALSF